jgi:hypothetical protein
MTTAMPAVLHDVLAVSGVGATFREAGFRKATNVEEAKETTTYLDRIENRSLNECALW